MWNVLIMAKINPLVIIALAGGAGYYFYSQNKNKTKVDTALPSSNLIAKGYYFVNCDKVIILDEQKAYRYVYNVSRLMNPVVFDALIWDGCGSKALMKYQPYFAKDEIDLEKIGEIDPGKQKTLIKDPKQAKFVFNLIRYGALGLVDGQEVDPKLAEQIMTQRKKEFEEMGIDTSMWDTTLPSKP